MSPSLLRRVLQLARVVRDARLTLTLLSIDDVADEFVLRMIAHSQGPKGHDR